MDEASDLLQPPPLPLSPTLPQLLSPYVCSHTHSHTHTCIINCRLCSASSSVDYEHIELCGHIVTGIPSSFFGRTGLQAVWGQAGSICWPTDFLVVRHLKRLISCGLDWPQRQSQSLLLATRMATGLGLVLLLLGPGLVVIVIKLLKHEFVAHSLTHTHTRSHTKSAPSAYYAELQTNLIYSK